MLYEGRMDINPWISQLRKGAAEFAVLSVLAKRDRYGLEVLEAANRGGDLVSEGSLYPLLSRLEKDGKVTSRWEVEDAAHPRKYYRLTPEGTRTVAAMLGAWIEFRTAMSATVEDPR
jgi:PadR family transcriptional regulator, regulatory protein PadR